MNAGQSNLLNNLDIRVTDLSTAAGLLTRISLLGRWFDQDRMAQSAWSFPLIGLGLGLIAGLILSLLIALNMPASIAALLALGFLVVTTGALHEDAIADCADGLGGGLNKPHCLEIMRDSRMGAYGVIALVLFLGVRWAAIAEIAHIAPIMALTLAATLSRMPMVLVMAAMPPARHDGLSQSVGRPDMHHAGYALSLSILTGAVLMGWIGLGLVIVALLSALPLIYLASKKISGQTGDVLGGIQQSAEAAILIVLAWHLT